MDAASKAEETISTAPEAAQKQAADTISALLETAKKNGSIESSALTGVLEKLDITPEQIEKVYDTLDALGVQIVGAELTLESDDELPPAVMDDVEEEQHGLLGFDRGYWSSFNPFCKLVYGDK